MIKILYLHAGAEMYGADKVLLDLIKRLDRTKFDPIVILPEKGVLYDALLPVAEVMVLEYPILRRKYFNPKGGFNYVREFSKKIKQIKQIILDKKINVIHTNTAAVLEGAYLAKKMKLPHIWSIHEIIVSPKVMFKVTSKLIAKYSTITTTDSNAVKTHLLSSGYFKNDIKVIYNGVDSDYFNPENDYNYLFDEWQIPKESRRIGMVGRVNAWKGQKDFLGAAEIIMAKHPDVYAILVGSCYNGEEWREAELEEMIASSPYHDRIRFIGYRTDSKAIYNFYDVFVLPSTNPDPLPTVVLETMATGKPIVGYKHGGVCEMVADGKNGLLAEVGSVEDLAAKIEKLLNDEALRKSMGEHSRERLLSHFSIESYVQNFSKLYEDLT